MPKPDYRSKEAEAYRKLYKSARWQRLRKAILRRDNLTCQRTGVLCIGASARIVNGEYVPAEPNSPVVNHKLPHKGDPKLFWDPANLECVSKAVHDSDVQYEEKTGRKAKQFGADGWPIE